MGVHTLGKADIFNSGFHGTWVNNEQVETLTIIFVQCEILLLSRDILTTNITQTWSTQALTGPLPGKFSEIASFLDFQIIEEKEKDEYK